VLNVVDRVKLEEAPGFHAMFGKSKRWAKALFLSVGLALSVSGSATADPYDSDPMAYTSPADGCITESNPSVTTTFCRRLGLQKGRLRGCAATENCFSSSAIAAEKYLPPWSYSFRNTPTEDAWKELQVGVETQGLKILQLRPDQHYILAAQKATSRQPAGASNFYEFLLRPEDALVLTRAVVDKTVYVYPLQQPVTDFGLLRAKLDDVRSSLGWLIVQ